MSCYIASTNNRFYVAAESAYGEAPAISSENRIPAVKLAVRQRPAGAQRRDKTGSRSFLGLSARTRLETTFELRTYLMNWNEPAQEPRYGPLIQAALGGAPVFFNGGTAGAGSAGKTLRFSGAHGLAEGQAVTFGGEIRFVAAVPDGSTVVLNAPFSLEPVEGSPLGATVTYAPSYALKSVSIWDYWGPPEAVNRIVCGAGVNQMRVALNGDFHEFVFSGGAKDVLDSSSFEAGQAGLGSFPAEPALDGFDHTIVPGHLGQAWIGTGPERFFTITAAEVLIDNDLDLRAREFGSQWPRCLSAGLRSVTLDVDVYETDDSATVGLYQAARQRSPVEVMFQLGQEAGQLCGVYMKSVIPEVPEFDDGENRLQWRFTSCRAQGTADDEITVAFG